MNKIFKLYEKHIRFSSLYFIWSFIIFLGIKLTQFLSHGHGLSGRKKKNKKKTLQHSIADTKSPQSFRSVSPNSYCELTRSYIHALVMTNGKTVVKHTTCSFAFDLCLPDEQIYQDCLR